MQLFEHQLQATQWMYDQEVLEGGAMQHLWAELPPHPQMPAVSWGPGASTNLRELLPYSQDVKQIT